MLKVVCLVDKKGTAIDRLAQGVKKYHDNIDYVVVDCHPKRPDQEQLDNVQRECMDADVIDAQYYRTLYMLRDKFPFLKEKKTILTANNPYAIEEQSWNDVDLSVGNNQYVYKKLGEITDKPVEYVPLTVDTDFWTFNLDWEPSNKVIMVANRIESKKGILPVATACADLDLHFILVGNISDPQYFYSIMQTGNIEFHENISDEKLRELYHKSTIHVSNSVDNFETGTLPLLEAMLCGVPCLTRKTGHVPELYNGENMVIHEGEVEDVQAISEKLQSMLYDKKKLGELRDKGWQTAKLRSHERRAYMYQKLYRQVMWPDERSVSVVVPIYDRPEIIRKCLEAVANQTHKNVELLIADDSPYRRIASFDPNPQESLDSNERLVRDFAQFVNMPVRYINTSRADEEQTGEILLIAEDYGLARARNEATIEATGDVIVYCDQRMIMEPDAIENFLKYLKPKHWLYGNKGNKKENFIENFSCVERADVINAGLFNERIYAYGGMSEEIRKRINRQGIVTEFVESAIANPIGKSSNRNRKRADIIRMKNRCWKLFDA